MRILGLTLATKLSGVPIRILQFWEVVIMDDDVCYICDGKCRAVVSKQRYEAGLTKCGAADCDRCGMPFRKTTIIK